MAVKDFVFPEKKFFATPSYLGMPFEDVVFRGKKGVRLHGWFIPGKDLRPDEAGSGTGEEKKPSILICSGNAGNRARMIFHAQILHEAGFNVLCFDYRGFGESLEKVDMKTFIEDAVSAYDYMISREDVDMGRTGVFGVSLGSMVCVAVASRRPSVKGVVAEAVFMPGRLVAKIMESRHFGPIAYAATPLTTRALFPFGNNVSRVVRNIKCPIFMIHGDRDLIAPLENAAYVYSMAKTPKKIWVIEGSGHPSESLVSRGSEYCAQLVGFLKECFRTPYREKWVSLNWQGRFSGKSVSGDVPDFRFYRDSWESEKSDRYLVTATFKPGAGHNPVVAAVEVLIFTTRGMMRKRILFTKADTTATKIWEVPGRPVGVSLVEYNNYSEKAAGDHEWTKKYSPVASSYREFLSLRERLISLSDSASALRLFEKDLDVASNLLPKEFLGRYFARLYFELAGRFEKLHGAGPDSVACWEKCIRLMPEDIENYYEHGYGKTLTVLPDFYLKACVNLIACVSVPRRTPRAVDKNKSIQQLMVLMIRLQALSKQVDLKEKK